MIPHGVRNVVATAIALAAALSTAEWLRARLAPRRIRAIAILGIGILAFLPLQIRPVFDIEMPETGLGIDGEPLIPAARSPIRIECRLLDGEGIVFDNAQVVRADVHSFDGVEYGLRLTLTDEGRSRVRRITFDHVGEELGFFLDGTLKSRATILVPLDQQEVFVPLALEREAARDLAVRIP